MTIELTLSVDAKNHMESGYDNPVRLDDGSGKNCNVNLGLNNANTVSYNSINDSSPPNGNSTVYIVPSYAQPPVNGFANGCSMIKNNISKAEKEKEAYANGKNANAHEFQSISKKDYLEYDPHQNLTHTRQPTTYLDTLFHLLKASLGTGILAMPRAFSNAGYVVGMIGTLFVGLLCTYNIHILLNTEYELCKRRKVPCMTYPETLQYAVEEGPPSLRWFSPYAKKIGNMFLIAYQIGTSAIYIVFIASNIKDVYEAYYGTQISIRVVILCLFVPLVLICWIPNLKLLVPFSTIANLVTVLSFSIIFYYIFREIPSVSFENRKKVGTMKGIPLFFGTVLFAMEAIGVIMPLKNEMKKPKKFGSFFGVLNASMLPISLLYALIGFFGYMSYGDDTKATITLNLPPHDVMAYLVRIFYSGAIYITYALSCYVCYEIVWINGLQENYKTSSHKVLWDYIVRTSIVFITFIMAMAIPNLDLFISLVGAFCLSAMGIAFPAIAQILVFWGNRQETFGFALMVFKNIIIIMIAILAFTVGISSTLVQFFEGEAAKNGTSNAV